MTGNRIVRVRTQYNLHKTETGRLSSGVDTTEDDKVRGRVRNLQNIPRHLKLMFVPEPGCLFVGADWAAIEWALVMLDAERVVREGRHAAMLDSFQAGRFDPHRFLASRAFGVEESAVTPDQRRQAKAFTFGYLYGGSPGGLADNARLPRKVGEQVCAAHDEAFGLAPWREETYRQARADRRVRTMGGWTRWFWQSTPKPTEILASRIQGSAADLMKFVLTRMFVTCPPRVEMLTTTHDAILCQAPEADIPDTKRWVTEQMQQPVPWLGGRSWRAEVKVGRNWKEA